MKYIIVGAVAGGASTAARLRRMDEKAEIIMFEKGEFISYANCGLPYYIGDVITERNKLFVQTAASFGLRFNIDIRIRTVVTGIDAAAKTITAQNLSTGEHYTERYDKLVLSPGAEPVRPPLPGLELPGIFTLRNVADTDLIKDYVQTKHFGKAVVIGAGFIGLEMAENLHKLGLDVTVIEMARQVLTPIDLPLAGMVQQHIRSKGVRLMLNTKVSGFAPTNNGLEVLIDGAEAIPADIVLLSIGVRPDTKLALTAGLRIGEAGGIAVNHYMQTSDPDIYAVGDAIELQHPLSGKSTLTYLAGPANKQGRICANNLVFGNKQVYRGSINTAIVKIFDLTVGGTGLSVKQLKSAEIPHKVSVIHANSHAGYYPGAQRLTIQIAFSPDSGLLLGAQVVGIKGVDKRLDVLASVIKTKGTIYDLAEFEHAYAPPFSSAKDPVNMAGFVAENILEGHLDVFHVDEINKIQPEDLLIDVRTFAEYDDGSIKGAINIPLDEIRQRLDEIPADRKIYLYCQQGLRGYLARRILVQNHIPHISNLSGGYLLWKIYNEEQEALTSAEEETSSLSQSNP